jgi:hypothetical protein
VRKIHDVESYYAGAFEAVAKQEENIEQILWNTNMVDMI